MKEAAHHSALQGHPQVVGVVDVVGHARGQGPRARGQILVADGEQRRGSVALADEAAAAAKTATLDNVRDRELRAEHTWRGLANQARAVAVQRAKVEEEKAAQRAEERAAEREEAL